MKKGTILMLAVVYLASILVVGIFGMRVFAYNETIYVEEIVPTSVTLSDGSEVELTPIRNTPDYLVQLTYTKDLTLIVNYEIIPADATNRTVNIVPEEKETPVITPLEHRQIRFLRAGSSWLTFYSTDGSNITLRILLYAAAQET